MKFIKFYLYDIKQGLLLKWYKYAVYCAFILLAFFEFYVRIRSYGFTEFSLGDCLYYIYGGIKEYTPSATEAFKIPYLWILNYVLILFCVLNFMSKDLEGFGQQTIYRSGSRNVWWLSKCLWQFSAVLVFFLTAWLVLALLTVITGGNISLSISDYMWEITDSGLKTIPDVKPDFIFELTLIPLLFACAMAVLQMCLCLFAKPTAAFIVSIVTLIASSYAASPFLIGNYAMAIRSDKLITNGVNTAVGITALTVILILSAAVGLIKFKHCNILSKG